MTVEPFWTRQRDGVDRDALIDTASDVGREIPSRDDLGAIGGMLGYGNVYHDPSKGDLPTNNYMNGGPNEVVGITGERSSFPGVGVEAERHPDTGYWGLRILDAGVWAVKVNFRCVPAGNSGFFQVTTSSDPKYADASQVFRSTIAYGNFFDVLVANDPGELVVPIVMGSQSWTEGEMKMTMYRVDGGTSSFSQTNLRN